MGYKIVESEPLLANINEMNSAAIAFQIAHILGCDPIILLGIDCCYRKGLTNFFGINKHHIPGTLINCKKAIEFMKSSNHEIINYSDNKHVLNTLTKQHETYLDILTEVKG
tara:strand:+ start:9032 stop:9364 length:333 start_codon:yes stop_codon:yes gene_type:complete